MQQCLLIVWWGGFFHYILDSRIKYEKLSTNTTVIGEYFLMRSRHKNIKWWNYLMKLPCDKVIFTLFLCGNRAFFYFILNYIKSLFQHYLDGNNLQHVRTFSCFSTKKFWKKSWVHVKTKIVFLFSFIYTAIPKILIYND